MRFIDEKDYDFSLHEFRLIIERYKRKLPDRDFIKKQKKLLKLSGINQDLNNKRSDEIREKCKLLGENGWTISPFWCPRKDETWYDTWFWMAYDNQAEKIADYFLENDYSLLKNIVTAQHC